MPSFWENIRFPGEREMDDLSGAQGQDMVTYVSHPAPSEGNSFPAVIVIMEAFGVTRHIEQVCDEYARHGYVAVAPALYHRQHPNPKLGYDQMPQVQQYMGSLNDEELIEDINVTIDYLQNRYQRTRGNKIGIVGYCVGGRITYLAATSCQGPQRRLGVLWRAHPGSVRRWAVPHRTHQRFDHSDYGQLRRGRRQSHTGGCGADRGSIECRGGYPRLQDVLRRRPRLQLQ